jgi:hypothetical protein
MNTQEINQLISNSTFDSALTVIDKYVFVNLDYLTNRDYQSQGINELIFLVGQHPTGIFVFLIRDGVNCQLTGLDYVVKTIVNNLNLTANNCYIYGYEDLQIPNTTSIRFDAIQMWCSLIYKELKDFEPADNFVSKKIAALFGRHDLYRLKIIKYLYENYANQSVLSYNSKLGQWNTRFKNHFYEDRNWHDTNCPIKLDFDGDTGWVPYQKSLQHIIKHVESYFLEVVCETDIYSNKFFTEKSLKNFYLQKPFILMSGKHSLKQLQEKGFKTFAPWINESYDEISCPNKRLHAIFEEIDRINRHSLDELNSIYKEMMPVFEHNRRNFLKFV